MSQIDYLNKEYIESKMNSLLEKKGYDKLYPFEGEDYLNCWYKSKECLEKDIIRMVELFESVLKSEIKVFRTIRCIYVEDLDFSDIGVCWSFEKEGALDFGRRNLIDNYFLIEAYISSSNIDWKETVDCYLEYSNNFSEDDENELRIKESSLVKIVKVYNVLEYDELEEVSVDMLSLNE